MDIIVQILSLVFWFVVILLPLVAIHEFGHLIIARLNGIKVVEYGIGIPPRIWHKKWKGIVWSVNWVLLGGFARIYGDHDAIDEAKETFKTNPEEARKQYIKDRFQEIIANQELEFFLQDNNLEYDEKWKWFESVANKGIDINLSIVNIVDFGFSLITQTGTLVGSYPNATFDEKKVQVSEFYSKNLKQLETLIDWEFDTKLESKEAFMNKAWWQQTLVLLGGVSFNLLTAFILFFLLFGVISTPPSTVLPDKIKEIEQNATITSKSENVTIFRLQKDGPAYKAGIRTGDELISFGGNSLSNLKSFDEFRNMVQSKKDAPVEVVYRSKATGETKTEKVELANSEGQARFGVQSDGFGYVVQFKVNNVFSAAGMAFDSTKNLFVLNFKVLGDVFVALLPNTTDRSALEYVGGPVAISSVSSQIFNLQGFGGILNIMAVISVALAAFNLLPLPALDGGRWVIITLNKILGKRNKRLEGVVISFTFLFLLGLGFLIAFRDVGNLVSGKGF
jgi:regulator of sigma E protease